MPILMHKNMCLSGIGLRVGTSADEGAEDAVATTKITKSLKDNIDQIETNMGGCKFNVSSDGILNITYDDGTESDSSV